MREGFVDPHRAPRNLGGLEPPGEIAIVSRVEGTPCSWSICQYVRSREASMIHGNPA